MPPITAGPVVGPAARRSWREEGWGLPARPVMWVFISRGRRAVRTSCLFGDSRTIVGKGCRRVGRKHGAGCWVLGYPLWLPRWLAGAPSLGKARDSPAGSARLPPGLGGGMSPRTGSGRKRLGGAELGSPPPGSSLLAPSLEQCGSATAGWGSPAEPKDRRTGPR